MYPQSGFDNGIAIDSEAKYKLICGPFDAPGKRQPNIGDRNLRMPLVTDKRPSRLDTLRWLKELLDIVEHRDGPGR